MQIEVETQISKKPKPSHSIAISINLTSTNFKQESPQANRCIGIFGLSERTTERDVKRIFTKYGHIEDVNLIFDNYVCIAFIVHFLF